MRQECSNCRYFKGEQGGNFYGSCRRYPPQAVVDVYTMFEDGESKIESANIEVFPSTNGDNWCGEWKETDGPNLQSPEHEEKG